MEKNVGETDKIIRIVLIIFSAYFGYKYSYWIWIITALLVISVITGYCMPYKFFKINTKK